MVRPVSTAEKLVGILTYGPVLLLALFFFVRHRAWKLESLMFIYPVAAMLVAAVTVSVDRYRLPFDLYLIILAAAAVDSGLRMLESRAAQRPTAGTAAVVS